jgi:hypothetical protein
MNRLSEAFFAQARPAPGMPKWLQPAVARVPDVVRLLKGRGHRLDKLTTGVIQALGLGQLKASHARQWERLKKNVHIIIEAEIKRGINPNDVLVILDDETYLIVFNDDDPRLAEAVAKRIARDASAKLTGMSEINDMVRVASFVVRLSGNEVAELGKYSKPEQVMASLRRVRERQETEVGPRLSYLPTTNVVIGRIGFYDVNPAFLSADMTEALIGKTGSALGRVHRPAPIQVPVPFESLATADTLRVVVDRLRAFAPAVQRRIVLRLTQVPQEIRAKSLAALAQHVQRGLLGIALDFAAQPGDDERVKAVRPLLVNVNAEGIVADEALRICGFALGAMVRNAGIKPRIAVRHVSSADLLTLLPRAGVTYANGRAVGPEIAVPLPGGRL